MNLKYYKLCGSENPDFLRELNLIKSLLIDNISDFT